MAADNDDFLKRLLKTFQIEADEHLRAMSAGLVELEKSPADDRQSEAVEKIFREAHSLKGAARAVNLAEIETLCHALESVFAALKGGRVTATLPLFDLLHQTLDALGGLLPSGTPTRTGAQKQAVAALVRRLEGALHEMPESRDSASAESAARPNSGEELPNSRVGSGTIRVATAKLDSVMRQTEELLAPRLAASQRAQELRETGAALAAWKKDRAKVQSVFRAVERNIGQAEKSGGLARGREELTTLLEYLDAEPPRFKLIEERLAKLDRSAAHDHRALSGMVDGLLHDVREMHMLPFSALVEAFPRLVRELAREQGKHVELVIEGGEIEIDRRILEEIKDPLNHLLRNAIDHGFEKPVLREQKGKPSHGSLTIAVAHRDSSKVEILVADDGAGIDLAKLREAAGRLRMVPEEELGALTDRDALALVFRSGVSTSPIVTDLSGRGLGLAIVHERTARLGGTISVETRHDAGTTFRIVLPLTLATFRGVLVRAGDQALIVPAIGVERVARVADKDIRSVEGRETIPLDGQAVALVRLSDALGISRAKGEPAESAQVVVLGQGVDRIAFRVEEVLAEQEVLVKGLGRQLKRVRNVAGASVLGTGQVVPVLNVADLMKSAKQLGASSAATAPAGVAAGKQATATKRSVLVVEDSITSRALLKNILESAGYSVTTAVDGVDGYTTLKTGVFDLVVSDVEMPRMDGFDLTAKVRADKQLAGLPVVLVTALGSREHRERGIDVGASAYIVKSSFDQSNLLEVIGRLI